MDDMTITLQTTEPIRHQSLPASSRMLSELSRLVRGDGMTLDAPYQRGQVWTTMQQVRLIESVLRGVPIPAIVINDRTHEWSDGPNPLNDGIDMYAVIDGKQRLTAWMAFEDNEIAIPASWLEPEWVEKTIDTGDGPYATRSGLSERGRRLLGNRALVPVVTSRVSTVAAEAEIYLLVNGGGTAQESADLDRAEKFAGR